jgi:hypothetical protein
MTLVAFIISFWTGMRKEEVHGLTLADTQTTIESLEFHIFPNDFRGLKTKSATRRNPQYLIEGEEEIDFVRKWIDRRHLESPTDRREKVPLFSKSQLSNQLIGDYALFKEVRQDIKLQLDDQSAVWHHLRDSALHTYYLRLLIRDDITMEHKPFFLEDECFSSSLRENFRGQLFQNDHSGRKTLFGAATLIGHADSLAGFKSYFHLTDWLLGYYVRHPEHLPSISPEAYSSLTGQILDNLSQNGEVPPAMLYASIRKQYRVITKPQSMLIHEPPKGKPVLKKRGRKSIQKGILEFDIAYYKMQLREVSINLKSDQELAAAKHIYENIQTLSVAKQKKYQKIFNYIKESYINHKKNMKYLQISDKSKMLKVYNLLKAININIDLSEVTHHNSRYNNSNKSYHNWNKSITTKLLIGDSCQVKGKLDCIRIKNSALTIIGQDGDIDYLDIIHFVSIALNVFEI